MFSAFLYLMYCDEKAGKSIIIRDSEGTLPVNL